MRVLLVNDYATPTGGAEIAVEALRHGLVRRGCEVRLFASRARPGAAEPSADTLCAGTTSRLRGVLQTANPAAAMALHREIERFRPDVVHLNLFLTQLSPLILPVLRDVPCVYSAHWYRAVCPTGIKAMPHGATCRQAAGAACLREGCLPPHDWILLMLQGAMLRRWRGVFDRVTAVSEAVRGELLATGWGPVEVVRPMIPSQRPARPPLEGPPSVVFAGRLTPEKGADTLLQAFARVQAQVPEARLTICGDGPERVHLEALATRLGVAGSATFTGHLPRATMESVADRAWVQAVPSRWREPFGLVAAEAMLRGTAVAASRGGGMQDYIEQGETGVLIEGNDPIAWSEALAAMLCDRDRTEAMGMRGRQSALAQFDPDRQLDQMLGVYEAAQATHAERRGRRTPTQPLAAQGAR